MIKEAITNKQGISVLILYIFGESSILLSGLKAGKDIWISYLIAMLLALPLMLLYARFHTIFPEKDAFYVFEYSFGKWAGRGVLFLVVYFVFDDMAMIIRDASNFVHTVGLKETPLIVIIALIAITAILGVKLGFSVVAKFSEIIIIVPLVFVIIAEFLLIPQMKLENILPAMSNGFNNVLKGASDIFTYPFAETFALAFVFSGFKDLKSPYKIRLIGSIIGGAILLVISISIIAVLGAERSQKLYYPFYEATTAIDINLLFQRAEVFATVIFIIGVFVKISISIIASCKGFARVLGIYEYKFLAIPISLLAICWAYMGFSNIRRFNEFILTEYIPYCQIFMVVIPLTALVVAEIKKKIAENKEKPN